MSLKPGVEPEDTDPSLSPEFALLHIKPVTHVSHSSQTCFLTAPFPSPPPPLGFMMWTRADKSSVVMKPDQVKVEQTYTGMTTGSWLVCSSNTCSPPSIRDDWTGSCRQPMGGGGWGCKSNTWFESFPFSLLNKEPHNFTLVKTYSLAAETKKLIILQRKVKQPVLTR